MFVTVLDMLSSLASLAGVLSLFAWRTGKTRHVVTAGVALVLVLLNLMFGDWLWAIIFVGLIAFETYLWHQEPEQPEQKK